MELNLITRWESVGKSLYEKGKLGEELERIKKYSVLANSSALHRQRAASDAERFHEEIESSTLENIPAKHAHHSVLLYCTLRRFIKGFTVGYLGKFVFLFFSSLVRSRGRPGELWNFIRQEIFSREILLFGSSLGGYLALFEYFMRTFRDASASATAASAASALSLASTLLRRTNRKWQEKKIPIENHEISPDAQLGLVREFSHEDDEISSDEEEKSLTPPRLAPHKSLWLSIPILRSYFPISRRTRVLCSAFFASSVAFSLLPSSSRLGISMFFFVRAIEILSKNAVESGFLPSYRHSDILLMSLASAQIVYSWLFLRETIDKKYAHFLDQFGGRNFSVQSAYANTAFQGAAAVVKEGKFFQAMNEYWKNHGGFPAITAEEMLSKPSHELACRMLHPHTPHCSVESARYFREGIFRALPVYGPVYLLPLILFRFPSLMKKPFPILFQTCIGILRSSIFLSSYCTMAWLISCLGASKFHHFSAWNGILAGIFAGFTVGIEKKNRRIELALYVLAQAIPAFVKTLRVYRFIPFLPHSEALAFIFGSCIIMHAYVMKPHLLRRSYLSLLRFFFGSGAETAGFHTRMQLAGPVLNNRRKSGEESGEENPVDHSEKKKASGRTVRFASGPENPLVRYGKNPMERREEQN